LGTGELPAEAGLPWTKEQHARDSNETARRDGYVASSPRFDVRPCKPGRSSLGLGAGHHHRTKRLAAVRQGPSRTLHRLRTHRSAFPGAGSGTRVWRPRHFEPGARTAWHTHPLGQILIVTAGTGWVQQWGGPIEEIREGDVVRIPPGQKHWHGATPATSMTHLAIQENLDGKVVVWMEQVSDEQYRK
jgi:mannose-6-phosphate isomerase-like protein (cupin superfamily)